MNGKGDAPRPVNGARYRANFERINWRINDPSPQLLAQLPSPDVKEYIEKHFGRKSLETPHNHRYSLTTQAVRARYSEQ